MPELPEVETVRLGLNNVTLHQICVGGDVLLERTIAHPLSVSNFLQGLEGTQIHQWHRRGKYLLAELNSPSNVAGGWLGVHLRMTGQLLWVSQEEPLQKHTRVRLFFPEQQELRFVDQRTFGQMWWVEPSREAADIITGLQKLGPEPFSTEFSVSYFQTQLQRRQKPIKNALLDQSIVAGVGNIYADEALFLSHIRPTTFCSSLTTPQIKRLRESLIQVLQDAITAGGSTIRNFLSVSGTNGNYAANAWVYNRAGEPCRVCQTPIQRLKLAGRSAHFCPECQPE
ncbi:MAG: DNA-formamidopyrimidine glycosylase [Microcoleaceae cyanobacterium]